MPSDETLVFDLETDGLLRDLTKIHCANVYSTSTHQHERYDSVSTPVFQLAERLAEADTIIGHNIIGFDIPAMRKLFPGWEPKGKIIDTYIWAACVWPNIKSHDFSFFRKGILPGSLIGKYNLESFGYRLGVLKGEFAKETDWKSWTPEMSDYCEQDVVVTLKLLDKLKLKETSWEQVELEMGFNHVIARQTHHGVYFDISKAVALYEELSAKREKLREQLTSEFPPFYKKSGRLFTPKRTQNKYTKAGKPSTNYVGYVEGCPCQKIELVEFNPGSAVHVARMLMQRFDWIPEEFTDADKAPSELMYQYERLGITAATTPTVNDEIVEALPYPEIKPLAEFLMLNKRCSQISEGKKSWLKFYNEETHRVHGACYQFGAVTGRCAHFDPNLAQVPAGYSPYGDECRDCFTTPDGYLLVGCDADGLEAVCKAHYIAKFDGGAFVKVILEGDKKSGTDIHSLNRDRLGLAARNTAKTWYYAFMYGAGDKKLGLTALTDEAYKDFKGNPADLGKKLRDKLAKEFPGLGDLIEAVKSAAKERRWLKGLDGRRIPIRHIHAALNSLLQSAGAVVMKRALVIADTKIQAAGLVPFGLGGSDYEFVLNVHDEFQAEVKKEHAELVGQCMADGIVEAAQSFNFRCPLSASYDIGPSWKYTH